MDSAPREQFLYPEFVLLKGLSLRAREVLENAVHFAQDVRAM